MKFQNISDNNKINNILTNSKNDSKDIYIWKLASSGKITSKISLKALRLQRGEIVFTPLDDKDENFKLIMSGNELVNFFIVDEVLLFQSSLIRFESPNRVTVAFPEVVSIMERRDDIRLKTPVGSSFILNFSIESTKNKLTKNITKDIFDLSFGGVSFIINKMEKEYLGVGNIIQDLVLNLDSFNIKANAKVISIEELGSTHSTDIYYECYRIGLEFQKLSPEYSKTIKELVFKLNKKIII